MSISLKVKHPTLPDVREPIVSIGVPPEGLRGAYKLICGQYPEDDIRSKEEIIDTYLELINEIDLENKGIFSETFFWKRWDRHSQEEKRGMETGAIIFDMHIEKYHGDIIRTRLRKDVVRFFLYLKAGYDIVWERD